MAYKNQYLRGQTNNLIRIDLSLNMKFLPTEITKYDYPIPFYYVDFY